MQLLRSHTRLFGVFFITWTLMQIVFFLVFWKESRERCQEVEDFHELKQIILALRKEVGSFRKMIGEKKCSNYIYGSSSTDIPTVYLITPTYARPTQKADLVRMSQTLMLVPNIHWIVVEDSTSKTALVTKLLLESGIPHSQLNVRTPKELRTDPKQPRWKKPRGVMQRNLGLEWLRNNLAKRNKKAILYFADDDNTYHVELFEEMRYTSSVSTWPVGLSGELLVEKPIVKNGRIIKWNSIWNPSRPYPGDMASFAINVELILKNPNARFDVNSPVGMQESTILSQLISDLGSLEPKAENCSKVLVWHTRTERANLAGERLLKKKNRPPSNHDIEV